jgi:FdrA protein
VSTRDLLEQGPVAVNVGIRDFAESLAAQEVPVVQVDWTPPRELEPDLAELLEELG